MTILFNLV